jgi:uncharacterized protein
MVTDNNSSVVILGISDNKERYSYFAYKTLLDKGFDNLKGVTPKKIDLPEIDIVHTLEEVIAPIHTLTVYVGVKRLNPMIDKILSLKPKRIILNLGTENQDLKERALKQKIEVIEGCTIVMLNTNQF